MFGFCEVIGQGRGIKLWRNQCDEETMWRNTFSSSARCCRAGKSKGLRWWDECCGWGVQPTTANPHFLLVSPQNWWSQPRVTLVPPQKWWLSWCRNRKTLKCLEKEKGWNIIENTTYIIYSQDGSEMGFEYKSVINSSLIDSWAHRLYN